MRDFFSPGCERSIEAARLYAAGDGSGAVDTRHLILGLFHDAEGSAYALATTCGSELSQWEPRLSAQQGTEPTEAMTLNAEKAIRQARSLAREFLVDRTVNSELLLVAVLETDAVIANELADNGLDSKMLRQLVIDPLTTLIPLVDSTDVAQTPSDQFRIDTGNDLHRILDAAGNRAREALRVLEDFVRFGQNDSAITGELKSMRHELASLLAKLPRPQLLSARDTVNDVGTNIAAEHEYRRTSLNDVVTANTRRLQEALRSLEEFGKVHDPQLGRSFEALRYRSYTLEKRLHAENALHRRLAEARLYLLLPATSDRHPWKVLLNVAIVGGVQVVQLRDKSLSDQVLLTVAMQIREATRLTNTLFIVNDRVDIALASNADGVHLGQDDMPISAARKIVGNNMLIGVSTHNPQQLQQAINAGADYVGIGPTFASTTKTFDALAGLEYVRQTRDCPIPAFVLGGVTLDNVDSVIDAGGRRIAVSSAILSADDPQIAARQLRNKLDAGVQR